jgi:DeoR family transcriptional regulator of aga operon
MSCWLQDCTDGVKVDQLNTIERQQEIVRLTNELGKVSVIELAQRFGVSEVTIRNDLTILDQKRLLLRSRGGAMVNDALGRELSLKEKRHKNSELKQRLGQQVAALINDDEHIILDSGTTTEQVAAQLHGHKHLTVMTNGLNVAMQLAQHDKITVMLTGGTLRKKTMSFYGPQAENCLRFYQFDKVILGADGFDMAAGLSTHFEAEANLNRQMCQVAREVIVVTDSSKFSQRGFHLVCPPQAIHTLVTDSALPADCAAQLQALGIRLLLVD